MNVKCCVTLGNTGLLGISLVIIEAYKEQRKRLIRSDANNDHLSPPSCTLICPDIFIKAYVFTQMFTFLFYTI
jgi:hypothetical protein